MGAGHARDRPVARMAASYKVRAHHARDRVVARMAASYKVRAPEGINEHCSRREQRSS